jgi:hypothetical protein
MEIERRDPRNIERKSATMPLPFLAGLVKGAASFGLIPFIIRLTALPLSCRRARENERLEFARIHLERLKLERAAGQLQLEPGGDP